MNPGLKPLGKKVGEAFAWAFSQGGGHLIRLAYWAWPWVLAAAAPRLRRLRNAVYRSSLFKRSNSLE